MSGIDDFVSAIASQESGGNYGAVNGSSGALGRYQILADNVTPWARQYLGIYMTPAQFMANPHLQDQLATAVLGDYVRKYGYRGAAAAWYSGNPALADSTTPQGDYPSIKSYVDSIINKMGNQPLTRAMTTASEKAAKPTNPSDSGNQAYQALKNADTMNNLQFQPQGISLADNPAGMTVGPEQQDQLGMSVGNSLALDAPVQEGLNSPDGTASAATKPSAAPVTYATQDKLRLAALQMARKYLGTPYVYGGTGYGGIDCSALVWRALQSVGINIPRTGRAQVAAGQVIPMNKLQPGDMVAFEGGNHVALYIGNNQVIEAAHPGTNVMIRNLGTAWDKANGMEGVSFGQYFK